MMKQFNFQATNNIKELIENNTLVLNHLCDLRVDRVSTCSELRIMRDLPIIAIVRTYNRER